MPVPNRITLRDIAEHAGCHFTTVSLALRGRPGIPEAIQNRIFEPGFSTKKRGWGLGLALARRIVEDYHRGHIRLLRSIPGVQTTFVLDLPEGSSRGARNVPSERMD